MSTKTIVTVAFAIFCLVPAVKADIPQIYGYWPAGGGKVTVAPTGNPVVMGGIEFVADPGVLTFGGNAAPFSFEIPNSVTPGYVTLGQLGTPITLDGPTEFDITVSGDTGFGEITAYYAGIPLVLPPFGPCNSNENCLAIVVPEAVACDLNTDGLCTALDIDLLSSSIRSGNDDTTFDLNGDGVLDDGDRTFWIEDVVGTPHGDADLNRRVEFADFLALSDSFGQPGGWAHGDFDGDGNVAFVDFLVVSKNFGLPKRPTDFPLGAKAVPEPASFGTTMLGLLICTSIFRSRSRRDRVNVPAKMEE